MIANRLFNVAFRQPMPLSFMFSTKKKQMELTIRTPYQTILQDFTGFTRLITKTQESALVIQNRTPPALHILPPGFIKLRLSSETKGVNDQYLHTGGWMIVHCDNSCEVNLMDIVDKKDVKADQIDKVQVKDADTIVGKYTAKSRRLVSRTWSKRAL